jgi:hypothetical protein
MRSLSFFGVLRVAAICLGIGLLPPAARAQSAADQPAPIAAEPAFTHARVIAISLGALAGMIVANSLTDGLVTPVLTITRAGAAPALAALRGTATAGASYAGLAGQEAAEAFAHAVQARAYLVEASRLALTAAGAIGGGYVGYWLAGSP